MIVVSVKNLQKCYGKVIALDKISFDVEKGSIFGFLGPNGAGKSTTIGIMFQFLYADSGKVEIFDQDIHNNVSIKSRMAVISDADLPRISGVKLLKHTARYYGFQGQALRQQIKEIVGITDTRDFISRSTSTLSKGQKSRVKIANALVSDPELIIADEPTSGLDPLSRRKFLKLIQDFVKNKGNTVFFSSHVIGEVEKIADHILILNKGRVINQGSIAEIRKLLPNTNQIRLCGTGLNMQTLRAFPDIQKVTQLSHDVFSLHVNGNNDETPDFLRTLIADNSVNLHSFQRENMNLEDIFLNSLEVKPH